MISVLLLVVGFSVNAAYAEPVVNVDPKRHSDLHAAQQLVAQAYNKLTQAQKANKYDMQGNVAKAKSLLEDVNKEIKAAAEIANEADEKKKKK